MGIFFFVLLSSMLVLRKPCLRSRRFSSNYNGLMKMKNRALYRFIFEFLALLRDVSCVSTNVVTC